MPVPVPGRIAEALRRSTVQIRTGNGRYQGGGSGVVIASDRIISNAHVVRSQPVSIETWDGRVISGSVVKADARRDLALISLQAIDAPPVPLAESNSLRPGTPVVAVGNPLGFVGALSSGVVHSCGRVQIGSGAPLEWVAADVRLAPGNSGGPLANLQGHLVGINTMITTGYLALAVPSRAIQRFLSHRGSQGRFGVTIRPVRLRNGDAGLMILQVDRGTAAESASLFPGDILIATDQGRLQYPDDLQIAMEDAKAGVLHLRFLRGNQTELRQVVVRLQFEPERNAA